MADYKQEVKKEAKKLFIEFLNDMGRDLLNDYTNPISIQVGLIFLKHVNKLEKQELEKDHPPILKEVPKRTEVQFPQKEGLYGLRFDIKFHPDAMSEIVEDLKKKGWKPRSDDLFKREGHILDRGDSVVFVNYSATRLMGSRKDLEELNEIFRGERLKNVEFVEYGTNLYGVKKTTEEELLKGYQARDRMIESVILNQTRKYSLTEEAILGNIYHSFEPYPNSVFIRREIEGKEPYFMEYGRNVINRLKEQNKIRVGKRQHLEFLYIQEQKLRHLYSRFLQLLNRHQKQ